MLFWGGPGGQNLLVFLNKISIKFPIKACGPIFSFCVGGSMLERIRIEECDVFSNILRKHSRTINTSESQNRKQKTKEKTDAREAPREDFSHRQTPKTRSPNRNTTRTKADTTQTQTERQTRSILRCQATAVSEQCC